MKTSVIKKNTYFVSLARFSHVFLAFILMPFATRHLGPEGYGVYALASTLMFFVFLSNDLGMNTYIIREVARDRENAPKFYSNSLILKLSFIIVSLLLLFGLLDILQFSGETKTAVLLFGIYGILTSIVQLNTSIFRAYEKMEFETLVLMIEKVVITVCGILVLLKGRGLLALCSVFILGGFISFILSTILLNKHFFKIRFQFDYEFARKLVYKSLPFGASLFLANLYNGIGIILLSKMQTAEAVGWFSAGARVLKFTSIIPNILSIALFPALSREIINSKEKFSELYTKGFKYICFLAIPLIAGISILSDSIASILFGAEFVNSSGVLKILAWASGLIFFNIFFASLFNAANYQKILVKIQTIALILNVCLNLLLIPHYAHLGSAFAMVVTEAVIFVTCIVFIYQKISRLQEINFIMKVIGSTCIMSIFTVLIKNHNVFAVIVLSTLIYFSVLYLMKGFLVKDIFLLKRQ